MSAGKVKRDIKRIARHAVKVRTNLQTQVQKPLAAPIRDRVERTRSYLKTQGEMTKWTAQIKQNREAECVDYTPDVRVAPNLPAMAMTTLKTKTSSREPASQHGLEQDVMNALEKQGIGTEKEIKVAAIHSLTIGEGTERTECSFARSGAGTGQSAIANEEIAAD